MTRRSMTLLPFLLAVACSQDAAPATPGLGAAGAVAPLPTTPVQTAPTTTPTATPTTGTATSPTTTPTSGTPSTPTTTPTATPTTPTTPTNTGTPVTGATPGNCQGFPLEGLKYSPGGDVLPNTCMPFDPTTNNPYAVRCIDAWPWYKTKYPGDQFCILPPAPDKGIQYGVHPQGKKWFDQVSTGDMSGYDNPGAEWVMEEGEEEEGNYETGALNTEAKNFYRNYPRMRGGSHHMIVSWDDGTAPQEVWSPGAPLGLSGDVSLPGAQRPDENAPKTLAKPAEDDGLYSVLPAKAGITFNMHHFNASGKQVLKEAWTNLWWEDKATIRVYGILGLDFLQVATLSIPPGTTQDLHYKIDIAQPVRMVTAFGHRHAWTTNFSAWVKKPGGQVDILYQSYDWFDEPTYRYDSMTKNPAPAPELKTDGASSGIRMLNAGEELHFNCHVEHTAERAKAEGPAAETAFARNVPLRFANEAFNAEMCILFGSTAAVALPRPAADATALPDFATID
jgi:hypothetical protein